MCGIAGFVDFNRSLDQRDLEQMTSTIAHRGPDDRGHAVIKNNEANIGLGHLRLSIIDTSPLGHQPMVFDGYQIIFNGEIYNFAEVRKTLEEKGHTFRSHSDTEVVLKSFIEWREKCVDRFIGMFAFIIYDAKSEQLFVFRDRAGVKPMYYYWFNNCFLFASELKAFHKVHYFTKRLNMEALRMYFNYGYIPTPHCIFENTFKLKPGSFLLVDLRKKTFTETLHWDVADFYNKPKLKISIEEAKEELERLLISAFQYRMVSDVPVGVFLSGGYDSSLLTGILQKNSTQKIKTFSIGFAEKEFNEAPHAKAVASYLETQHTELYCTADEASKILTKLPFIYDEPFGDNSAIPTTLVSSLAVQHVKVALSADAGDETFAGYNKYFTFLDFYNKFRRIPVPADSMISWTAKKMSSVIGITFSNVYNIDTRIHKIHELLDHKNDICAFFKVLSQFYGESELDQLILPKRQSNAKSDTFFETSLNDMSDPLNKMLALDYKTYLLDDILTKVDRSTMSVSLEGREPMLDHRIIEFAAQMPSDFKYRNNVSKFILKEIAHKYVPAHLLNRPKMGFGIPLEIWLNNSLKPLIEHYFDESRIRRNGLLNPIKIEKLKTDFLTGRKFNMNKLWILLMFEMWHEYWMEN
jgi:asparagine synthase (glutamine-hydrolysing)